MPYSILKKSGGFKVCKSLDKNKCFSNKAHKTYKKAYKQMIAIILNEKKK